MNERDVSSMLTPVRCTGCGAAFDRSNVSRTATWPHADVWRTPCCGRVVADRIDQLGEQPHPDYVVLDAQGCEVRR